MRHVCKRTKEGTAQATAGEFHEETMYREATVDSTKGTNVHWNKMNKNEAQRLTVSVSNTVFFFFVTGLKVKNVKNLKRKRKIVALEMYAAYRR
jgi:hypothetical protein